MTEKVVSIVGGRFAISVSKLALQIKNSAYTPGFRLNSWRRYSLRGHAIKCSQHVSAVFRRHQ